MLDGTLEEGDYEVCSICELCLSESDDTVSEASTGQLFHLRCFIEERMNKNAAAAGSATDEIRPKQARRSISLQEKFKAVLAYQERYDSLDSMHQLKQRRNASARSAARVLDYKYEPYLIKRWVADFADVGATNLKKGTPLRKILPHARACSKRQRSYIRSSESHRLTSVIKNNKKLLEATFKKLTVDWGLIVTYPIVAMEFELELKKINIDWNRDLRHMSALVRNYLKYTLSNDKVWSVSFRSLRTSKYTQAQIDEAVALGQYQLEDVIHEHRIRSYKDILWEDEIHVTENGSLLKRGLQAQGTRHKARNNTSSSHSAGV